MSRQEQPNPQDALTLYSEIMRLQKKALLIEDNYLILHLHSRYLTELGFNVDIANTQEKALEYAFDKSYELIVTDLGLEDSCDESIIINLRKLLLDQTTPLIVVTAKSNESLKSRCLAAGANEFFVKPLKKFVLKEILQKLVSEKIPSSLMAN